MAIKDIGIDQFLAGVLVGVSYAVIMSLLANYLSELTRFILTIRYGLYSFIEPGFWLHDFSVSLLMTSIGFLIACATWFASPKMMRKYGHQKVMRSHNYVMFLF